MIIYDCEIIRAVPNRNTPNRSDLEYCKGWHDHKGMGISVIGVYDYYTKEYRVFCKDNFMQFLELITARSTLVSFNGIGFDNKLCDAHSLCIPEHKCYDLLLKYWEAVGPSRYKGFKLGDICQATLGLAKSGSGADAPELWQRGKIGTVIDYCLHDIALTKKLMDYVLINHGVVPDPRDTSKVLKLELPKA